jgi:hypothetical protein
MIKATAIAEVRSSFTYNFLVGATTMSKLAFDIDQKGQNATEGEIIQHKAFVAGSIMQSVAALEAEVWSLLNHGIGHHLGSIGLDNEANAILSIVANSFEKESTIVKYDLILQLTRNKRLDLGKLLLQDLDLLIKLRNEITHFKSLWTSELERKTFFKTLEKKDPTPPSFYPSTGMNFFPNICLSFRRAKWAVTTSVTFIEFYYNELGIKSPLEGLDKLLITV